MRTSLLLVALVPLAGCEIFQTPGKVHELEGRVTELSAQVAALRGEAPGGGSGAGSGSAGSSGSGEGKRAAPIQLHDGAPPDKAEGKPKEDKKPPPPKEKPHWGYDAAIGPDKWGSLDAEWSTCGEGKAQSPIDIEPRASKASPITFRYAPTAATVVDNGHTLQVNLAAGSSIEIDGKPYGLVQFHVHTPSEHTIAGERFPLEVHLVHKDVSGKLAVIGVLYDTGAASSALDAVFAKWPKQANAETKLSAPFDPSALLPENRGVFRYDGSLTTPPCSEDVVWNVMRRVMTDSKAHLAAVTGHYKTNARPVQPLGARKVD